MTLHRFEETINGRVYNIEVSEVQPDRWRAYLVLDDGWSDGADALLRQHTYRGRRLLVGWLTRAHQVAAELRLANGRGLVFGAFRYSTHRTETLR